MRFSLLRDLSCKMVVDSHESLTTTPAGSNLEFQEEREGAFLFKVTRLGFAYEIHLTKEELFALVRTSQVTILPDGKADFRLVFSHEANQYFNKNEWARMTFRDEEFVSIVHEDGKSNHHIHGLNYEYLLKKIFKKEIEVY